MANQNEESSESTQKITADEPVQSIEGGDAAKPAEESAIAKPAEDGGEESQESQITEEQWRAMMDLVLAIYEYREEEYVPQKFS